MITIGLLGGVASGKSTVAQLLAEQGATVIDADRAAHEVLATSEVEDAIVGRWGDALLGEDGAIDRAALAERVFGDTQTATDNRRFLENLVHPAVRARLRSELAELRESGAAVAVLDIPLLLEAGYRDDCDLLLFIDTPDADRAARAAERGWSAEEFRWREAAQAPISKKRASATDTVVNDRSPGALRSTVDTFWRRRVAAAGAGPSKP